MVSPALAVVLTSVCKLSQRLRPLAQAAVYKACGRGSALVTAEVFTSCLAPQNLFPAASIGGAHAHDGRSQLTDEEWWDSWPATDSSFHLRPDSLRYNAREKEAWFVQFSHTTPDHAIKQPRTIPIGRRSHVCVRFLPLHA